MLLLLIVVAHSLVHAASSPNDNAASSLERRATWSDPVRNNNHLLHRQEIQNLAYKQRNLRKARFNSTPDFGQVDLQDGRKGPDRNGPH
jgi:hypothetical protein